jgi:acid phosphatase type 7
MMKKPFYFWLVLVACLLVFGGLIWAFSQHGTIGLFRVNGTFKMLFIAVAIIGLLMALLAWLAAKFRAMGKTGFSRWLAALALIIAIPSLVGAPAGVIVLSGATSPGIGETPPQLMIAGGTGSRGIPDIAVTFNTKKATTDNLVWGKYGGPGKLIEEANALKSHVFMMTNLEPDTQYWYRLNDGETHGFVTPKVNNQLHFAAGGDAHFGSTTSRGDLRAQMLVAIANPAHNFDILFNLGDLVHWGFAAGQWQEAFRAFSPITSTIPVRFLPGNHDTLFAGTKYFKTYASPAGMALATGSQLWSRIDVGNIHVLCLDVEWSAESYTAAQAKWLEAQLQDIPADDWKIVMSHGFYYASGYTIEGWHWYDNPETIDKLTPLFEKYSVDMVFSAHDHQMELLQKSGVTYVICGGFGGLPDNQRAYTSPYSLWYAGGQYGFMDVAIDGNQANIVFRAPDFGEIYKYKLAK